jgi:hypothetical protein
VNVRPISSIASFMLIATENVSSWAVAVPVVARTNRAARNHRVMS